MPLALEALEHVADPVKSEVAELWEERGEGSLAEHLADLRARLAG